MIGICKKCGEKKELTKHSKIGNHQPPFIRLCRNCHDDEHGSKHAKPKLNKKYVKGTKRMHKKK